MRNSLLLAPMPTAGTSQILGNTECFAPLSSNLFSRRVLSGEFTVVNKHLIKGVAYAYSIQEQKQVSETPQSS